MFRFRKTLCSQLVGITEAYKVHWYGLRGMTSGHLLSALSIATPFNLHLQAIQQFYVLCKTLACGFAGLILNAYCCKRTAFITSLIILFISFLNCEILVEISDCLLILSCISCMICSCTDIEMSGIMIFPI